MIENVKVSKKGKMDWYSWKETCDKCKRVIFDYDVLSSAPPNLEEAHFCVECLRHFLDEKIPYEEAFKQYKNKG